MTFLDVPFTEKGEARALGARWETSARRWYVPEGVDVAPFARWRPRPDNLVDTLEPPTGDETPSLRASCRATIHVGKSVGSEIFHRLRKARRTVSVVSPYLTSSLVRELLTLQDRGLVVTLVTTDADVLGKKDVAAQLVRQERHADERAARRRRIGRRFSLGIGFLSLAGAMAGGPWAEAGLEWLLFVAPAGLLAFLYFHALRVFSYTYHFTLRLKVVPSPFRERTAAETPLVHAKAYVIDDVAYLGSLNFTNQGFFDHFETCVRIEPPDAAAVARLVTALYEESRWAAVQAADVGAWLISQGVLAEPIN